MTATLTRPQTVRLSERVETPTARVDRSAGVIRGVRIIGKESKNGREYSNEALDDAARLYEGCRVMDNHPSRSAPTAERGFGELVGTLRNVRREGDAVKGDLVLIKSGPLANRIMEAADSMPHVFGLSHNADGRTRRQGGKVVVESLASVRSVDIVLQPATNESLFESFVADTATVLIRGVDNLVQEASTMIGRDPEVSAKQTAKRVDLIQQAAGVFLKALRSGLREKLAKEEADEEESKKFETHSVSSPGLDAGDVSESYRRSWNRGLHRSRQTPRKSTAPTTGFENQWNAALDRARSER